MAFEIRPLGFGEILDQGFRLFRENMGLFLLIYGAFWLPPQLVMIFVQMAIVPDPAALAGMSPEQQMAAMGSTATIAMVFWFVSIFIAVVSGAVAEGAIVNAAARLYLNEQVTFGEAVSAAISRLGALIWTGILKGFLIMLGFLALIIPGIYLIFRYALASQTVMLEGLSGSAALKRSRDLMKEHKHINQLFGIGFLFWVVSLMVGGGNWGPRCTLGCQHPEQLDQYGHYGAVLGGGSGILLLGPLPSGWF
jgi:uncharacterized membrane protein YjgN (DUF898 family)